MCRNRIYTFTNIFDCIFEKKGQNASIASIVFTTFFRGGGKFFCKKILQKFFKRKEKSSKKVSGLLRKYRFFSIT